jgi:hypothetical protein
VIQQKFGILTGVKLSLILSLILLMISSPLASAQTQPDYLNEFSEPGDISSLKTPWEFITQDGVHRTIDVYQYCQNNTCVLVPFDIENHILLTDSQAESFFESLALQQLLPSEEVTAASYSINGLNKGSITCNLTVPSIDVQAKALTLQLTVEDIVPKLLPENAAKVVEGIYELGESVGVVKSASVPVLVLGVACVGGDYLESLAASSLVTCQMLLENVRNNLAYEGQYRDIMNCQNEAIQRLRDARYSPDLLSQHLETQGKNQLEQLWTDFLNWVAQLTGGSKTQANVTESNYDMELGQLSTIQTLNQTFYGAQPQGQTDFGSYKARINLKVQETNSAITGLNAALSALNSNLFRYTTLGGSYTTLLNLTHIPGYDFSGAIANQSLASLDYQTALSLNSTYRYNSAVNIANAGLLYALAGSNALNNEQTVSRAYNLTNIALFGVAVVLAAAVAVFRRRRYAM